MRTAYLIEITRRDGSTSHIVCSERTATLNPEWEDYRVVRTATGATYAEAARAVELSGISGELDSLRAEIAALEVRVEQLERKTRMLTYAR